MTISDAMAMIENVARAICRAHDLDPRADKYTADKHIDQNWGRYLPHARAALDSIEGEFRKDSDFYSGAWQPIETAPKDDTPVLTYRKAGLVAVAVYVPKAGTWDRAWAGGWMCVDGAGLLHVTHWLPLPPPPNAPEKNDKIRDLSPPLNEGRNEILEEARRLVAKLPRGEWFDVGGFGGGEHGRPLEVRRGPAVGEQHFVWRWEQLSKEERAALCGLVNFLRALKQEPNQVSVNSNK